MLNNGSYCPSGYNQSSYAALAGTAALNVDIAGSGLYVGPSNTIGYGQAYLTATFNTPANIGGTPTLCWQTFKSSSGRPYFSYLAVKGGAAVCPAGYTYVPASALEGTNGDTYWQADAMGAYFGSLDGWSQGATASSPGYQDRYVTAASLDTVCFRVMGVDADPTTAGGVYPVILGVKTQSACPAGYTYVATTAASGADGWSYLVFDDNSTALGPMAGYAYGGGDYAFAQWNATYSINSCFKYYPITGPVFTDVMTMSGGSCPAGFASANVSDVNGWNGNAYIQQTAFGLRIGGLYSWGTQDNNHGYLTSNITTSASLVCYEVTGVSSFP